tara:strand:- start:295 stop:621 length:327 start_codon:yes stop_codon:yes gene_type:complete
MIIPFNLGKILIGIPGEPTEKHFSRYEALISTHNPEWRRDNKLLLISQREQRRQPLSIQQHYILNTHVDFLEKFNRYLIAADREEIRARSLMGTTRTLEQAWPEYEIQ